jgi:hypothetical protein
VEVDVAGMEESSSDCVNEPAVYGVVADMLSMLEAVGGEDDGAYAGMDTIAVHTEEHIEASVRSFGEDNIPDMMVAVSCLAALVGKTSQVSSEVGE